MVNSAKLYTVEKREDTIQEMDTSGENIIRKTNISKDQNEYTYILIRREGALLASYKIPLYSIRAEMTTADGNTSYYEVRDIFSSEDKAIRFFNKLSQNLATPMNLPYIIEDEMSCL